MRWQFDLRSRLVVLSPVGALMWEMVSRMPCFPSQAREDQIGAKQESPLLARRSAVHWLAWRCEPDIFATRRFVAVNSAVPEDVKNTGIAWSNSKTSIKSLNSSSVSLG